MPLVYNICRICAPWVLFIRTPDRHLRKIRCRCQSACIEAAVAVALQCTARHGLHAQAELQARVGPRPQVQWFA